MKTIDQLLKLSQNPYYKMSEDEKEVLEHFLSKEKAKHKSQEKGSESSPKKRVTVRNVVKKAPTGLEESGE